MHNKREYTTKEKTKVGAVLTASKYTCRWIGEILDISAVVGQEYIKKQARDSLKNLIPITSKDVKKTRTDRRMKK